MTQKMVVFRGFRLEAVQNTDGAWLIPLKTLCNSVGLNQEAQRARLARLAENGLKWPVAFVTKVTAEDGKSYETTCLPVESIPMWAGTVSLARANGRTRELLVAYQDEIAELMAALAFGEAKVVPSEAHVGGAAIELLRDELATLRAELRGLRADRDHLLGELAAVRGSLSSVASCHEKLAGLQASHAREVTALEGEIRETERLLFSIRDEFREWRDWAGHTVNSLTQGHNRVAHEVNKLTLQRAEGTGVSKPEPAATEKAVGRIAELKEHLALEQKKLSVQWIETLRPHLDSWEALPRERRPWLKNRFLLAEVLKVENPSYPPHGFRLNRCMETLNYVRVGQHWEPACDVGGLGPVGDSEGHVH